MKAKTDFSDTIKKRRQKASSDKKSIESLLRRLMYYNTFKREGSKLVTEFEGRTFEFRILERKNTTRKKTKEYLICDKPKEYHTYISSLYPIVQGAYGFEWNGDTYVLILDNDKVVIKFLFEVRK